MPELEIRNLHVAAGDKQILRGLDLTVERGEVHALMGPNGSGKSTLANAIMGNPAFEITEGTIIFRGQDITELDPDERARLGPLHGLPVPGRHPGRDDHEVPAHGDERPPRRARRGRGLAQGVPRARRGGDGADQRPEGLLLALPQRGLLGRREEAPGDAPARAAAPAGGGARRDRLGPRHRRAERRRRRREQRARAGRPRRPDHHALPADPAPRGADARVDHVRRADRQGGRPRPRRRSSSRRATAGSATRSPRRPDGHPRRRRARPRVPGPRPGGPRVPRQRGDVAEAARGHRRDRGLLRAPQREHPPRRLPARGGGDGPLRGRPRPRGDLARRHDEGDGLHEERDRGDQPRRLRVGPAQRRAGRRDRPDAGRAPLEHRPVAAAVPGGGRRAALPRASGRTARSTSTSSTRTSPTGA